MKNLIVASTSTLHGQSYLAYLKEPLKELFANCTEIVFIPYARPGGISHSEYTSLASKFFKALDISVKGLHEFNDPLLALNNAQGIFTGGGNTFVLLNELYKQQILPTLRTLIFNGTPYLGTSAGSNICGLTVQNTNDMPIVYPPSFKALGVIPFNINPHYLDPIANSKHMGETRETRIKEFHTYYTTPVVGLREGSWLRVKGDTILLEGQESARCFQQDKDPIELAPKSTVYFS